MFNSYEVGGFFYILFFCFLFFSILHLFFFSSREEKENCSQSCIIKPSRFKQRADVGCARRSMLGRRATGTTSATDSELKCKEEKNTFPDRSSSFSYIIILPFQKNCISVSLTLDRLSCSPCLLDKHAGVYTAPQSRCIPARK